jgi:hypothetical protein
MSSNINSISVGRILVQSGIGAPTHVAPQGSIYVDATSSIQYLNVDGANTWKLSSSGGAFLSLSGGTVTGGTIFTDGLSASTLNITNYIDFNTGTTNPSAVGGRTFFDNTSKALSYYDLQGNNVPIAMGQQLYTRVWNATSSQIDKGKVIAITGTTNGLPSAILAVNTHTVTSARPIGLSAENIPVGSEGLVLNNGILSGITLNTFANGDTLYLSDTTPGDYVSSTYFLSVTARTNEIGYVLETGTTSGKIYVNISNEDSNLSLTNIERNILEGNAISTGVFSFSGITLASTSTFNVGAADAWIVDNTTNPLSPDVMYVRYSGQTNIPSLYYSSATETYLLITSAGTLTQQTTFPTPQQRRQSIYLGKMGHGNRTNLINAFNEPDVDVSPISQLRDMFTPIKLINDGVYPSPYTGLTFNTSSGTLWGLGIGFVTNQLNPSSFSVSANSPTTFQYRTQTGGTASNRIAVDPANYDLNGVITPIGTPTKQATNQRIYLLQNGQFRMQYGQQIYTDLTTAIAAVSNETFTTFSNFRNNAILIAVLSIRSDASLLSDIAQAKITFSSKFGEVMGGTGGISTTTLQQAYDNSVTPEIVINSTLDGLTIKNGTGDADSTTHLLEGQNAAGSVTSFITADGGFSGSSVSATTYYGLPIYQRLNDNDTINFFNYCGLALSGTSQNDPGWQISRISWSSTTPTTAYAVGAWSGRTTLIYT